MPERPVQHTCATPHRRALVIGSVSKDGSVTVCPVPEFAMGTYESLDVSCTFTERLLGVLEPPGS